MLRFQDAVRSGCDAEKADDRRRVGKITRAAIENLLEVLNGDWRVRRVQTHVKVQPDDGDSSPGALRKATADVVYAALSSSFMFGGLKTVPAASRCGTCSKVLSSQVCAEMCHGLLNRALKIAFPKWKAISDQMDEEERGNVDFHKQVRSKIWRCLCWTGSFDQMQFAAVATVVSEPLDHLLMQVQKDSEDGGMLLTLPRKQNQFLAAQQSLSALLTIPINRTALSHVFEFYGGDSHDDALVLCQIVVSMVLKMSAELWYRCEVFFNRFPFKLVAIIDTDIENDVKDAVLKEFFNSGTCCLDVHFGCKVHTASQLSCPFKECDYRDSLAQS
jgi:hypothetical protein